MTPAYSVGSSIVVRHVHKDDGFLKRGTESVPLANAHAGS
jgi:hypothetical protein